MVWRSITISFDPTTLIQGHARNTEQGFIPDKSPNIFTPPWSVPGDRGEETFGLWSGKSS